MGRAVGHDCFDVTIFICGKGMRAAPVDEARPSYRRRPLGSSPRGPPASQDFPRDYANWNEGRGKMKRLGLVSLFSLILLAFWGTPALAAQNVTVNFANAPQGTHFVTGTPAPSCTVSSSLTVTCPAAAFELAGVGNTNATATLAATYSAIVDCFNPGQNPNNPVESHTQTTTVSTSSGLISPQNGRLTISPLTATAPTATQFQALATCPNPNWTPVVRPGSTQLVSFTFTVTFVGFTEPAITITGNDP